MPKIYCMKETMHSLRSHNVETHQEGEKGRKGEKEEGKLVGEVCGEIKG